LIMQRLLWIAASIGIAIASSLFFDRFDPKQSNIKIRKSKELSKDIQINQEESDLTQAELAMLSPLPTSNRFHFNLVRLIRAEILLLVKGLKWYWLAGMAIIWIGCVVESGERSRNLWYMLSAIWPVLIWARMGEREVRYQAEQLVFQVAYPLTRVLVSSWLAGILFTAVISSGVLIGRVAAGESLHMIPWLLGVVFIPTFALALGIWSRSSKMFEVLYPILWYLGPLNKENGLSMIDYLGIHPLSPANTTALGFTIFIFALLGIAFIGRRRQMMS